MAKSDDNRRSFLKKASLGVTSMLLSPLFAGNKMNKRQDRMEKNKLLKIRPLGFQWETQDPFLFCVHHEDNYPEGNDELGPNASLDGRHIGQDFIIKDGWRMYHGDKIPGFPGHPHRGFETITVVRKGIIDHADSTGAAGRYGNGDVQWMTAGKGVQHSEMFPLLNKTEKNPLELFQIWLNLPKKSKMVEPHFKMFWSDFIPVVETEDAMYEVLAGRYNEQVAPDSPPDSWANDPENDVLILNLHLKKGKTFTLLPAKPGVNRSLYVYEGNGLEIEGTTIPFYNAVDVISDETLTLKATSEDIKILVLQGKPINETVIQYGPFVMNSKAEIQQAFEDYHATQFGGWPWERYDMVHSPDKGRFALHADGREELKDS